MTIIETAEERRKRRASEAMAAAAASVGMLSLEAWLLMLLAGGLHSTFAIIPAFGFGPAVLVVLAVLLSAHMTDKFRPAQ
ncbi:hypothetical protein OTB20_08440 [Streptomyces sp. H27-H1]|uniref:hypothetical protein n=1 Tax=Streptomyces sp. H27-H1 TaxID=2996461 RepID=UPI002271CCC9|nr:hypothetical protein [Streptomyces sp. H27-H1]MCY0926233.1 hypothetical protein [Streptomyces sp. H27-H1]